MNKIFRGKTLAQLALLEQQIQKKLQGGEGIDVGKYVASLTYLYVHNIVVQIYFSLTDCLIANMLQILYSYGYNCASNKLLEFNE